jgi:predicted lipoprotein with Yx(FWY)xxD motif
MTRIRQHTLAVVVAGVLAVPGCAASPNAALFPPTPAAPAGAADNAGIEVIGPAAPTASPAPVVHLRTSRSPRLGTIVTDSGGITVYRSDRDSARPSRSRCSGTCAIDWRPVIIAGNGDINVRGLDRSDVGTVARDDGSLQVTVGGWPVYRFVGDKGPGQTRGHGRDGEWFAITATGDKAGRS